MSKTRTVTAPRPSAQARPSNLAAVGRVTAGAAGAGVRFVKHRPDTRWPALCLILLYPLGELGHFYRWSPLWLAACGPLVAVVAWVALSKEYGTCRYTKVSTVLLALAPAWLAVSAVTGVFRMRVLVGYSAAAVGLWLIYAQTEIITERKRLRRAKIDWNDFRDKVGLKDSNLIKTVPTRLGTEYKIDVRGTGHTASHWVKASGNLAEHWASAQGFPPHGWVHVRRDLTHAGQILVEERIRNPWLETNGHPVVDSESEWKLPASRSIHDGPLEIGADPSTGEMLGLPVYVDRSCKHVLVIAATGGGKTTLVNNEVERATACVDSLTWLIDTTKGTLPGLWADAADWGAGVGENAKALEILRAAKTVITERSRLSHGENHDATPTAPVINLVVDESGNMQGSMTSRQAQEWRELIGFVFRSARSGGVVMVLMSQRGVFGHLGSGDAQANAAIRVCGRVERESDMAYVMEDWERSGVPNMFTYGQGFPGVVAIQAPGQPWMAGRAWNLSDFPTVRKLAAKRGVPTAQLEPAIAAKLGESYANRRHATFVATVPAVEEIPVQSEPEEDDVIARHRADIDRSCAELEAMQIPDGERMSLGALQLAREELDKQVTADRKIGVPEHIYKPVLGLLRTAGDIGVSRGDLLEFFEPQVKGRTVERWLRLMVDDGIVVRQGSTSNARYVLPKPSGAVPKGDGA